MTNRRKFSAEFRAEAIELVISSGREHPDAGGAAEQGPVEWAKYKALQAENAELKREIEFLGKVGSPDVTVGGFRAP